MPSGCRPPPFVYSLRTTKVTRENWPVTTRTVGELVDIEPATGHSSRHSGRVCATWPGCVYPQTHEIRRKTHVWHCWLYRPARRDSHHPGWSGTTGISWLRFGGCGDHQRRLYRTTA